MSQTPNAPKRPQRRSTGLGDTCTVQLRLTAPQADWLRSTASTEGISIASVVRGMIDAERVEDTPADRPAKLVKSKALPEPEVVKGWYAGSYPAMAQPGEDPASGTGRASVLYPEGWHAYSDRNPMAFYLTESQAIAWCLKGVLP